MLKRQLWAMISGWLLTGGMLGIYFAIFFHVPAAGGTDSELAGWRFSMEYFLKALPFALLISLFLFFLLGPLAYWVLQRLDALNYWSVGVSGIALGLLNPFLHEVESAIPYSGLVFLLGMTSVPIGFLLCYAQIGRSRSFSEKK